MSDSRSEVVAFFRTLEFSSTRAVSKIAFCLCCAALVALLPNYHGLSDAGVWAFFILVLAAGLWITEAMPAFAVGLLVIGLEIAILGRPGGVFAQNAHDWERFVVVWGSPLVWLFFGGFVLAAAAEKTGLTQWLARMVMSRAGNRPSTQLLGCMVVTFVFSMFISNTATASMMIAVLAPVLGSLAMHDPLRRAFVLGVAFAANLGGMGTVIGSPPNAIAAGALSDVQPINFSEWMMAGLPPSLLLLGVAWVYLVFRYPSTTTHIESPVVLHSSPNQPGVPSWQRLSVVFVFTLTVGLWLTSFWHGIPSTVIAFVPICTLTAIGVLKSADICAIRWDVLLLIAGGLSLGVAVTDTGLANWLVDQLPLNQLTAIGLALAFTFTTAVLSNLMSNTAATNMLTPIAIAASTGFEVQTLVPIALGASAAMCLPISTPPNAIAYGSGEIDTHDLLQGGLLIGLIAPLAVTAWCWFVFSR